jgi:hypothetical protein
MMRVCEENTTSFSFEFVCSTCWINDAVNRKNEHHGKCHAVNETLTIYTAVKQIKSEMLFFSSSVSGFN